MHIFNVSIPDRPLTNIELSTYARELEIPHFRGVVMRVTLPQYPFNIECDIVNLNTSDQYGCHWVCYFDSYGQITPVEIQRYLKAGNEFKRGSEVIQRNTDIVQAVNTSVCGHLCLFVLKPLTNDERFQLITCNIMVDIHRVIGKIPFKPKKGFVLPKHCFTGPYNPLHLQLDSKYNPLPGNEPYISVDAISMRHNICYRDNDTSAGKRKCDRKMVEELNALVPEGRREKVDRQLL